MRTTLTLDPDVEQLIQQSMQRTRRSFKQTVNAALRAALQQSGDGTPFVVRARPLGLRAGLDPAGLNKLVDELAAEAFGEPGP